MITKRTLNYLVAILEHVPVVSIEWVKEISRVIDVLIEEKMNEFQTDGMTVMLAQEQFPTTDEYWIRGDEQVRKCVLGGPQRSLLSKSGLFEGMIFLVIGTFTPPAPSRDSIIDLIEHGGGRVLYEQDGTVSYSQAIVIVDRTVPDSFKNSLCVSFFWLLDCISNYRIELNSNYLLR